MTSNHITPSEEVLRQKLILLDRAMVSTDDNYPTQYRIPLDDLIKFIHLYTEQLTREARAEAKIELCNRILGTNAELHQDTPHWLIEALFKIKNEYEKQIQSNKEEL